MFANGNHENLDWHCNVRLVNGFAIIVEGYIQTADVMCVVGDSLRNHMLILYVEGKHGSELIGWQRPKRRRMSKRSTSGKKLKLLNIVEALAGSRIDLRTEVASRRGRQIK